MSEQICLRTNVFGLRHSSTKSNTQGQIECASPNNIDVGGFKSQYNMPNTHYIFPFPRAFLALMG